MVYFALVGLTLMAFSGFADLFTRASAKESNHPVAANLGVSIRIAFLLSAAWLLYTEVVVA